MKKVLIVILCICILGASTLMMISCNNEKDEEDNLSIVDMEGNTIVIPKNVSKVACISQSATDFMIAFGLGDKIVGTYRSFTYNPWTIEIYPNAVNYKAYSYSVTAEELLNDGIELVITQDTEYADSYRNVGIPVVAVHQYSPTGPFDDEMYDTARIIGKIFNVEDKANAWIEEVQDTISEIQTKIGSEASNKTVYYINGEKAKGLYYSDGGNSMISRVLNIAGVQLATEKYEVLNVHKVSDEEMINLNPDAMLIGGAYQNNLEDALNSSKVWSALNCVKTGKVYRIPVAMIGIENVGVETSVMLKYVASLFSDKCNYDAKLELKLNIKKYFNYDLSDADVDNMFKGLSKTGERMVDAN